MCVVTKPLSSLTLQLSSCVYWLHHRFLAFFWGTLLLAGSPLCQLHLCFVGEGFIVCLVMFFLLCLFVICVPKLLLSL